jgi:hypothetical protein
MWSLLISAALQIFGENGPIGQYFKTKQKIEDAKNEVALARINADKELAVAQAVAESSQMASRLSATSQSFKQQTFWLLVVPVLLSICFPSKAELMWHNFGLMPEWFQTLFISVYCSIWAIPYADKGLGAVSSFIQSRREYKLEKYKINREAYFAKKRAIKGSLTQEEVDTDNAVLDAMENH